VASAIAPERASGVDELSAVASITDVYVSNDLQVLHDGWHHVVRDVSRVPCSP
jgi:hypothetical protein